MSRIKKANFDKRRERGEGCGGREKWGGGGHARERSSNLI